MMALAGVPVKTILSERDQTQMLAYQAIAKRADLIEQDRREELANMIVNRIAKLFSNNG